MTKVVGWVGALVFLGSVTAACSSAHTEGTDTGIVTLQDGGGLDSGSVLVGEDGGGGVVILVDGALALADGAIVDRDGSVLNPIDGGAAMLPDTGVPTAHIGHPCTTDADCPGLFCSPAGTGFGYCSWLCGGSMVCPDDAVCHSFEAGAVGYCMARCTPTDPTSCAMGFVCEPGIAEAPVCYPGCTADTDCPAGTRCGDGLSGTRACYTPTAVAGGECAMNSDCPQLGYCLDEGTWGTPHGLCVTFCDLATHSGCTTDTTCVPWGFGGAYGSCVPTCDAATPCRTGYECVSTGTGLPNACVARCMTSADCTAPRSCNFVTGRCG